MIGIALLTLAPGRMGGSEGYARGLTRALASYGSAEYVVAVRPGTVDAAGGLPALTVGAPLGAGRPQTFVRAALSWSALRGADVVHYPFTVPLPLTRGRRVLTLHDVLHLEHPSLLPRKTRAYRRLFYDAAARAADRVIVPSELIRERAVERLGIDPERVRVIPHAIDRHVFHPGEVAREPFLLYPARFWPHKNHATLLRALSEVRRERPEFELVLTGGGHEDLSLPPGVRSLGQVSDAELAQLYRRASALIFPSRYEGFGLPVLEAMASGCPVAMASGTAAAEIADGAAVLFDADSVVDIAAAVARVLDDAASLAEQGVERARKYTWERTAKLHDDVYAELA